ncbi:MAG: TraR/DksA family transcriptional regulator [Bacteroidetes bacterium]|nr:TraR/DksA family transcriptional regulator [Bacteroidota bacterium]
MAKKKTASKASKPAKKAAAKKPVKKAAPPKKAAPKKAVAKKPAKAKPAPKKAAKPAKKAVKAAPKKAAKPAPKKPVAKKAAPAPKKAPAKPAPKPVAAKAPAKPVRPAPAPAPKPVVAKPVVATKQSVAKAPVKKEPEQKAPAKPLVTQTSAPNIPKATPMVKKQVSTLEAGNKDRYSDSELEEFKAIINAKLEEARKDYDLLKQTLANTDNNGTEDTSPSFKMIEDGSETLSREETAQLAGRQEKFIKHLEDALLRIRNKTYGICRVTGKLISKERLRLVPHATLSIEAKQQMSN